MSSPFLRAFPISLAIILFLTALTGCGSRPSQAQRLFDKGEYQAVIDKYPDLEIARRARAKLAEALLTQKDYNTVLTQYADTPAAHRAKNELAQQMFDQGRYRAVLDSFPHSPLAPMAKERLADSLFAAGQVDQMLTLYPDTPKAKQIKEERAAAALAPIKKLRGDRQKTALEEFMKQHVGTEAYKEAGQMLSQLRSGDVRKPAATGHEGHRH